MARQLELGLLVQALHRGHRRLQLGPAIEHLIEQRVVVGGARVALQAPQAAVHALERQVAQHAALHHRAVVASGLGHPAGLGQGVGRHRVLLQRRGPVALVIGERSQVGLGLRP